MENNFGLILLEIVRNNKGKFIGLLRRNGVLVDEKLSNEVLTNTILKAMQKSESFKKEVVLLMAVLASSSDDDFKNTTGSTTMFNNPFSGLQTFDANLFSPTSTTTTTTATTTDAKKEFEDTTFGKIFNSFLTLGNTYLQSKELDVRKEEAKAVASTGSTSSTPPPPKSNTGLYIGLGVGVLAIAGLLIFIINKKK
jgi:hypothetical protein